MDAVVSFELVVGSAGIRGWDAVGKRQVNRLDAVILARWRPSWSSLPSNEDVGVPALVRRSVLRLSTKPASSILGSRVSSLSLVAGARPCYIHADDQGASGDPAGWMMAGAANA